MLFVAWDPTRDMIVYAVRKAEVGDKPIAQGKVDPGLPFFGRDPVLDGRPVRLTGRPHRKYRCDRCHVISVDFHKSSRSSISAALQAGGHMRSEEHTSELQSLM